MTTRLAVIRLQMPPDLRKVHKTVDLAKQVIVRDVPLEAEAVKQRLLHHAPLAHHRPNLLLQREENQHQAPQSSRVFQHRVMGGSSSAKATTIGPVIGRGDRSMDYFAGLDISMDETHVCVLDREGVVVRESKTESTAQAIAGELSKAPSCCRIVFETGRMAPILFHGLSQLGLPVVCVESRQAYQALKSLATHKTDRNDARGLAHLARTGFFKPRACEVVASSCATLVDQRAQEASRTAGDLGKSDPRLGGRVR